MSLPTWHRDRFKKPHCKRGYKREFNQFYGWRYVSVLRPSGLPIGKFLVLDWNKDKETWTTFSSYPEVCKEGFQRTYDLTNKCWTYTRVEIPKETPEYWISWNYDTECWDRHMYDQVLSTIFLNLTSNLEKGLLHWAEENFSKNGYEGEEIKERPFGSVRQ